MIADWTVDVGPESPWIVLPWDGWVDLYASVPSPAPAATLSFALPEVQAYPELQDLLAHANNAVTRTSKVDVFAVHRDEADPEIAEAGSEQTSAGLGSYLDLVAIEADRFGSFDDFERVAREAAGELRDKDLPLCCAEIVIRAARLYDRDTFGWTLYAVGFGPHEKAARTAWSQAARALLDAFTQAAKQKQPEGNRGE